MTLVETLTEQESLERAKRIRDRLASVGLLDEVPTETRFRYFSASRAGPRCGWSTERVGGKFLSFVWGTDDRLTKQRVHAKRKDAKARALHLYEQAKEDR